MLWTVSSTTYQHGVNALCAIACIIHNPPAWSKRCAMDCIIHDLPAWRKHSRCYCLYHPQPTSMEYTLSVLLHVSSTTHQHGVYAVLWTVSSTTYLHGVNTPCAIVCINHDLPAWSKRSLCYCMYRPRPTSMEYTLPVLLYVSTTTHQHGVNALCAIVCIIHDLPAWSKRSLCYCLYHPRPTSMEKTHSVLWTVSSTTYQHGVNALCAIVCIIHDPPAWSKRSLCYGLYHPRPTSME